MVIGMAMSEITITFPQEQLTHLRQLVAAGRTGSVSAFVKRAVDTALTDVETWQAMLETALAETTGPLTAKERAWADSILSPSRPKRSPRKRSAA